MCFFLTSHSLRVTWQEEHGEPTEQLDTVQPGMDLHEQQPTLGSVLTETTKTVRISGESLNATNDELYGFSFMLFCLI